MTPNMNSCKGWSWSSIPLNMKRTLCITNIDTYTIWNRVYLIKFVSIAISFAIKALIDVIIFPVIVEPDEIAPSESNIPAFKIESLFNIPSQYKFPWFVNDEHAIVVVDCKALQFILFVVLIAPQHLKQL